jgi:TatA/E family protein of Tat protein translocase
MGDLFAGQHMLLILIIVLLFFGGKKLPELMRGLGRGLREFKDAKDNVKREIVKNGNNKYYIKKIKISINYYFYYKA